MRLVIQRVKEASVSVEGDICGKIGRGLLVLFAVHREDEPTETHWLVEKLVNLRLFEDSAGKMNFSVKDIQGEILLISQFTLYANSANGRRPDFIESAPPELARSVYDKFALEIKEKMGTVQTGIFGAKMEVHLINDGPVTLIVDGKKPEIR